MVTDAHSERVELLEESVSDERIAHEIAVNLTGPILNRSSPIGPREASKSLESLSWTPEGLHYSAAVTWVAAAVILGEG